MLKLGSSNNALAISILAILIASASIGLSLSQRPSASATPIQREFFVVTPELDFNETVIGIPHYVFTPTQMTVNLGDAVTIHFYNTADDTNHTFTIPAYGINVNLAPGEHRDIKFTANQAGVFAFNCQFHPTTMRGELAVLAP